MTKFKMNVVGNIGPEQVQRLVTNPLAIMQTNLKVSRPGFRTGGHGQLISEFQMEIPGEVTYDEIADWIGRKMSQQFAQHNMVFVFITDAGDEDIKDWREDGGDPIPLPEVKHKETIKDVLIIPVPPPDAIEEE